MTHLQHHENIIYSCPMHSEVRREKPGICSECGMTLVRSPLPHPPHQGEGKKEAAHNKHQGHSTNVFKTKFWVSLILSIPVVLYSDIVETLLNWQAPVFPGSQFMPFVLGSIIFFYGGLIFLQSAYRELRARMPGMMTLIALAISTAYFYSVYVVLTGGTKTLFWELATLITVMLLGHWMEMRAVSNAQGALKELSKLLPDEAELASGRRVPISELKVGDLVLVRPGGRVPADGEIVEGNSDINESLMTGESNPVSKSAGDIVIAGTINGDGALKIRVTQIGEKTFLAGVMRLVAEAQSSKSRLQLLSDRAAFYLTIIAVVTGTVTLVSWLAYAEPAFAIERAVAVLVIACPHALGLAIPLVASISTTKAANNGFLVKQRLALEAARSIDIVLFDKTGTLTKGEFGVEEVMSSARHPERSEGSQEDRDSSLDSHRAQNDKFVLQYAASVNAHSEHPIAKAIVAEAKKQNIELLDAKNFQRIPGKGARAEVLGNEVVVGSESLFDVMPDSIRHPESVRPGFRVKHGMTRIFVVVDKNVLGSIALADQIREESREAVKSLHSQGIKTAMITGDSEDVAKWVASELGLDEYFSRVLPEKKAEIVKNLQEGRFENWKPARSAGGLKIGNSSRRLAVAMVGDGINDAPALTQADLGIAIGAGTNVAIESAGIILVKNDPRDIAKIIRLSQLTYTKMIQNLFWATGYNVIAIPLAAGVLAAQGIVLQPALAALFMSLSTVIVAVNAVLLGKKDLDVVE